jgi:hypothetical protein
LNPGENDLRKRNVFAWGTERKVERGLGENFKKKNREKERNVEENTEKKERGSEEQKLRGSGWTVSLKGRRGRRRHLWLSESEKQMVKQRGVLN